MINSTEKLLKEIEALRLLNADLVEQCAKQEIIIEKFKKSMPRIEFLLEKIKRNSI